MIQLVTVDENNRAIERRVLKTPRARRRAVALTPSMSLGDPIFIRPDWPPIGCPEFAEKLRAWHAEHNPKQPALFGEDHA